MLQYLTEVSAIFKISLHTASYAQAVAGGATGGGDVGQKGEEGGEVRDGGEELKRRKMSGRRGRRAGREGSPVSSKTRAEVIR